MSPSRKPLVVVAGQTPPPVGGQNVMIARIVEELSKDSRWRTRHLAFRFTPSFQSVRKARFSKLFQLLMVYWRFFLLLFKEGRPDLLLYPSGGPQTVPLIRDILLVPILAALSRRVIVQFHAAGIANRLKASNGLLEKLLVLAYRRVSCAVVMTEFNRCDPESLHVPHTEIIPHRLPDDHGELPLGDVRSSANIDFLYAGHLYGAKGTPQLVRAFCHIAKEFPRTRLVLMGEFLPPYSREECLREVQQAGLVDRVELTGVLGGRDKHTRFQQASIFVFPSIAEYESFGLVLVEAMKWSLPVIATDWRGNADVLGRSPGGIYVSPNDLERSLEDGMRQALSSPHQWKEWGKQNRVRYERLFQLTEHTSDYRDFIAREFELC